MSPADADLVRRRAIYAGACTLLLVFSAMMIWTATGPRLKLPWYDPLGHRWIRSTMPPTGVAMDYYARVGLSLAAGALAAMLAGIGVTARRIPDVLLRALGLWAVGIALLGIFLYGYSIGTRIIEPPPPGTITQPEHAEPQ